MKTIVFFNNKGGVGKTSLCYHLAWMYADLGLKVIAADLDPQANLTSMFVEESQLEGLWSDDQHRQTVYGAFRPLLSGTGDVANPHIEPVNENIGLVVGDLQLSRAEDELSIRWPQCLDGKDIAFRVLSALSRIVASAAEHEDADVVIMDVGPNLGALNRAALIAADYIVVPLAPDIYSLQGLRNLGPTIRDWRVGWKARLNQVPNGLDIQLPNGYMRLSGYILMQHSERLDRPVQAYGRWMEKIPGEYREAVLTETTGSAPHIDDDEYSIGRIKHYRSLMPMAMEAHKPIFHLKPADGAIGAHMKAVNSCYSDFKELATRIANECEIKLP